MKKFGNILSKRPIIEQMKKSPNAEKKNKTFYTIYTDSYYGSCMVLTTILFQENQWKPIFWKQLKLEENVDLINVWRRIQEQHYCVKNVERISTKIALTHTIARVRYQWQELLQGIEYYWITVLIFEELNEKLEKLLKKHGLWWHY